MIEILILLSLVTLFSYRIGEKFYISYVVKLLQLGVVAFVPTLFTQSYLSKILSVSSQSSLLSSLLVFVLALEAEHFQIRRWIKESIFLLMIIAIYSGSLAVILISVVLVFLLLMVCRKNRLIDFISTFLLLTSFLIYFSELFGSYNNYGDKYVVYFSGLSEFLFPTSLILSFVLVVISSWGFLRSMIFTPVFASLILLLKFNKALQVPNVAVIFGLLIFTVFAVNNLRKYIVRKNIATAINVLCSLSFLNVLFSALNNNYSLALAQALLISIVLYCVRIFNLDKNNGLIKFKTITIYFVLLNISFFPLGMSGLHSIDSLANSENFFVGFLLVINILISWIILFLSLKSFKEVVVFNLWESSLKERFYSFGLLVISLFLSYINLPQGFVSKQYSRILVSNSYLNCCEFSEIQGYSFNISLLILLILFCLVIYGLSILDFKKVWLIKYRFINIFSSIKPRSLLFRKNATVRETNRSKVKLYNVINLVGQSSSYMIVVIFFLFFVGQLLILIE
ncbi:hypothetical protein [Halobacteriovorax sp. HLS]|uniref:hypothetical protein n=1 Tax=Halobacteriovorax sp. HLS TaxID=2234000 RepID=UPI000FDB45DD|nr:hypothetical protein [Halobacteriovorax sp. HLS]